MTYDYELTLIQQIYVEDKKIGVQVPVENKIKVLCDLKSIGRTEFYNAAAAGLKPELVFIIHRYEYNGETQVEFEGKKYRIIRTYAVDFEEIELTCERVIGCG